MAKKIKIGEPTESGLVPDVILGQSDFSTVFICDKGELRWEYAGNDGVMLAWHKPAVERFNTLLRDVNTYLPEKHRDNQKNLLGKSLFRAFEAGESEDMEAFFANIDAAVRELAQHSVRFQYVCWCLYSFTAIAIASLLLWALASSTAVQETNILAGLAGAAGACVSVLQRIRKLDIDWNSSRNMIAVEGVSRIAVGFFFGVLFALMCQGNLVLGALKEELNALLVFATISGFSERFVPELMEKLEATAVKDAQASG